MTKQQIDLLIAGVKQLKIEYSDEQLQQLIAYYELLVKWNKTYSLTALTDPEAIIINHLLDGLSIVNYLSGHSTILDVGSGMGVPGIIVAIMLPNSQVSLVDSNSKKIAFLQQVKIELKLNNASIFKLRIESYVPDKLFSVITARAFSGLDKLIQLTNRLLTVDGIYLAMKGSDWQHELDLIATAWSYQAIELKVPYLDAQRFLIKVIKT